GVCGFDQTRHQAEGTDKIVGLVLFEGDRDRNRHACKSDVGFHLLREIGKKIDRDELLVRIRLSPAFDASIEQMADRISIAAECAREIFHAEIEDRAHLGEITSKATMLQWSGARRVIECARAGGAER